MLLPLKNKACLLRIPLPADTAEPHFIIIRKHSSGPPSIGDRISPSNLFGAIIPPKSIGVARATLGLGGTKFRFTQHVSNYQVTK